MGFSTSAATAVIGVAIFVSVHFIVADVIPTFAETMDSYSGMRDRAIDQAQTDITVKNVTNTSAGASFNISIAVENTGSVTLKTSDFHVLVNGSGQSFNVSSPYFYPENMIYFNLTGQPSTAKIKVVTNNGVCDYYTYSI
ncbi:MAG: hypothetical protein V5A64_05920 [Candidatus Thermoplasmatota archaeon]